MFNMLLLEVIRTATRSGACGECRGSGLLGIFRSQYYCRERNMLATLSLEGVRTATRGGACGGCRRSGLCDVSAPPPITQ